MQTSRAVHIWAIRQKFYGPDGQTLMTVGSTMVSHMDNGGAVSPLHAIFPTFPGSTTVLLCHFHHLCFHPTIVSLVVVQATADPTCWCQQCAWWQ